MKIRERSFGVGSKTLLTSASFVIVIAGLKAAGTMILPILVAVFLSVLAAPMVLWLERRGVAAWAAVTLAMLSAVAILAFFGALLTSSLVGFQEEVPTYQTALTNLTLRFIAWLESRGIHISTDTLVDMLDPGVVMSMATNLLGAVGAALSNTLLVALTMMFILLEFAGFPHKLRAALDDPHADLSNYVGVLGEVQRYLAIKTLVSLATGGAVTLLLLLIEVDFPLLWGLVAFLLNYVPNIGSIVAALPVVLISIVQPELGTWHVVAVIAGYVAINMVLGNIVEPHLLGRRLGLSPLVVFGSLVFWGWVWGPVGMLLSVPLTVAIKIMLEGSDDLRWIAVFISSLPEVTPDPGGSYVARIRLRRGVAPEDVLKSGVMDRVKIDPADTLLTDVVSPTDSASERSDAVKPPA